MALRRARPRLHRALGRAYLAGVLLAGVTGLPLGVVFLGGVPHDLRPVFYPSALAFESLAAVWLAVSAVALVRVRQRRFDEHRAWMIRSYSLTFAAVTSRALAPLLLVVLNDPAVVANGGVVTWPLNLIFAEWLIRRQAALRSAAAAAA
jgi:hypothetical protein